MVQYFHFKLEKFPILINLHTSVKFSAGAGVFLPEPEFFLPEPEPEPEVKKPEFAQLYNYILNGNINAIHIKVLENICYLRKNSIH